MLEVYDTIAVLGMGDQKVGRCRGFDSTWRFPLNCFATRLPLSSAVSTEPCLLKSRFLQKPFVNLEGTLCSPTMREFNVLTFA